MNDFTQPTPCQALSEVIKGWSRRGGIYQIQCTQTKKAYLGSTGNIIKRLKQHYHLLTSNRHPNPEMQSDFNLYGPKSFVVGFIKLVPAHYDRKQLYQDEQDYLDVVRSFQVRYYNQSHQVVKARTKPAMPPAVRAFIRKHVDPYNCSRLTCDTFEVNGQMKTVIAYQFQDQIPHYHTLQHAIKPGKVEDAHS